MATSVTSLIPLAQPSTMLRSTNQLAREGLRAWTTTTVPLCSRRVAWLPRAGNSRIMSQPQIHFLIARSSMAAANHGQYRASACVPRDFRGGCLTGPRSWVKGSALGNVGPLILTRGLQAGSTRGRTSLGSSKPGDRPFSDKKPNNPTPDNVPPEDGLTRYPTLSSPQGILRGLDYMGTTVFALSGTVTAGQTGMDLLGCVVVGTITATGGGTIRDLLLGNNPVFWMQETEYLWMCVLTCISIFFLWSYLAEHGVRDDMALLNWADAMGVGAFCCIGTQAAIRKGLPQIVCVACGMLTSTFGGVIRDVLCSRPPRILFSHAEIYASTALFGSMVYIVARASGLSPVGRIVCGFMGGAGLRVIAFTTDIRLPSWVESSPAAIESVSDGQNKGDEAK